MAKKRLQRRAPARPYKPAEQKVRAAREVGIWPPLPDPPPHRALELVFPVDPAWPSASCILAVPHSARDGACHSEPRKPRLRPHLLPPCSFPDSREFQSRLPAPLPRPRSRALSRPRPGPPRATATANEVRGRVRRFKRRLWSEARREIQRCGQNPAAGCEPCQSSSQRGEGGGRRSQLGGLEAAGGVGRR